jgi:hypothetical protein
MVTCPTQTAQKPHFVHISHTFCGLVHPKIRPQQGNGYPKKPASTPTKHPAKPKINHKNQESPTTAKDCRRATAIYREKPETVHNCPQTPAFSAQKTVRRRRFTQPPHRKKSH